MDDNLDNEIMFLKSATLASNATGLLEKVPSAENYGISLYAYQDLLESYIEAKTLCQDDSLNVIMHSLTSFYKRIVRVVVANIAQEADEYFGETIATDLYRSVVRLLESSEEGGFDVLEQLGYRICQFVEVMNKSEISIDSAAIFEAEMESLEDLYMLLVRQKGDE